MDNELKPCPFCGGEAWIDERGCFIVYCLGCGTGSNAFDTEAQAIAAWNLRDGKGGTDGRS
jgi:Lar family restriction alleviation protein